MKATVNGSVGLVCAAVAIALVLGTVACGGRTVKTTAEDPSRIDIAQLWTDPVDLETRDLFAGPAAGVTAPTASQQFTFVEADRSGFSPGYDVRDGNGLTWSVKLGQEAQSEVASSRILWAIGFHQLPTWYLPSWTLIGGPEGKPGPGRFRPELPDRKVAGEWSWHENDFVNTAPFKGLIVANVMLNNWDWKASNNRIYEVKREDGTAERQYIVRDLGASLGKTSSPLPLRWLGSRIAQGSRNRVDDFEEQRFIEAVDGDRLEFDYDGIYQNVVDTVRVEDVVWTARLLSRLSNAQWNDAFRAAGYPPDQASRYVAKMKAKVAEGLALAGAGPASASTGSR